MDFQALKDFKERLRAARSFRHEHGSLVFHCRVPEDLDFTRIGLVYGDHAAPNILALHEWVTGWQGVTLDMILPGEPADPAPFDVELVQAYFGRSPDVAADLMRELIGRYRDSQQRLETARGN